MNYGQGIDFAMLQVPRRKVRASYDSAQTNEDNINHWAAADLLTPSAANNPRVRQTIVKRARYEVIESNSWLKGTMLTLANDFVGSGPTFQIVDDRITPKKRRAIEKKFAKYSRAVKLRQLLWRLRIAKGVDGEGWAMKFTNNRLRDAVKVDWKVFECDLVHSPGMFAVDLRQPSEIDGVEFDENGIPTRYWVETTRPTTTLQGDGSWVPADMVIHWFRKDRGWLRGVSEFVTSLPLCAVLRRYTRATVEAAEAAANVAGVLQTQSNANIYGASIEEMEAGGDIFPLQRNSFVVTPRGYELKQLTPEQPTDNHKDFVSSTTREIFRPVLVPHIIGSGSSSESNFASGVLDTQGYWGSQKVERMHCEEDVTEPIVRAWWEEAIRIDGYLNDGINDELNSVLAEFPDLLNEPPEYCWRWDNKPDHFDPVKVATARQLDYMNGFRLDRDIQEQDFNRDVEDYYQALEAQKKRREELDLPIVGFVEQNESLIEEDDTDKEQGQ